MTPESARAVQVEVIRELEAPPEEAWRAWSDPEQVRRWWGPAGFTCTRADIDFRVGGSSLVTMKAPPEYGGGEFHNRWTYTAIIEPTRIEFLSTFAHADGSVARPADVGIPLGVPHQVPHVVDLEPLPGNRTRVRVVETGYTDEAACRQSEQGQEQCLDKMQALFARG